MEAIQDTTFLNCGRTPHYGLCRYYFKEIVRTSSKLLNPMKKDEPPQKRNVPLFLPFPTRVYLGTKVWIQPGMV
jgi:hypothetical protein